MSFENEPGKSLRPSRSERPGLPRMLATLMVDPSYFIFRLVSAAAEGLVTGIYKIWENRRNKKIAKKIAKSAKKVARPPDEP